MGRNPVKRATMTHDHNAAPINPIPPVVVALFLIIAGVEIAFYLGSKGLVGGPSAVGWRIAAVEKYGFFGDVVKWMWGTGRYPAEHVMRFFTYPFIHGAFTSTLFACVMLLALGKMVAEVMGPVRMVVIFFACAVAGGLAYTALPMGQPPLIGAFPAVYGLIGAFTYLLWLRLGALGESQIRAFSLIGVLLALQLIFGLFVTVGYYWVAEVVGFVTGFALSVLLVPGGFQHLLNRIRER